MVRLYCCLWPVDSHVGGWSGVPWLLCNMHYHWFSKSKLKDCSLPIPFFLGYIVKHCRFFFFNQFFFLSKTGWPPTLWSMILCYWSTTKGFNYEYMLFCCSVFCSMGIFHITVALIVLLHYLPPLYCFSYLSASSENNSGHSLYFYFVFYIW